MSVVGSLRAPGCLVCALPTKVRAALNLDHAQGLSARCLALRYRTPSAPLSTSAVRLHLKTHVPPPPGANARGGSGSERLAGAGDYAAFIEGAVDPEGVLVATIRRTLRDLATMEGDVATARSAGNDADAIRAMTVVLRTKHLLVRELKAYTGSTERPELPADLSTVPTVFDALIDKPIDDQVVLEVTTRALLQKLRAVEAEYLTAVQRNPETAERALSNFLKTQATLERALQRLHDARQHRDRDGHFASAPANEGAPVEAAPTVFDGVLDQEVNAHAISEAVTRAIADKIKHVEQDYQGAVRAGRGVDDRALEKFLKMLPLLQRALQALQETAKPRDEIDKTVGAAVEELIAVAFAAVDEFVKADVQRMHKLIDEFAQGRVGLKLLQQWLEDYKQDWKKTLGFDLRQSLNAAVESSKLLRKKLRTEI